MALHTEDERQARIRARLALLSPDQRACVCQVTVRCRAEQSERGPAVPVWDLWAPGDCPCGAPTRAGVDLYSAGGLIAAWRPDVWPSPMRSGEEGA